MSNAIARPAQRFRFGNAKEVPVEATVGLTTPVEKPSFALKLLVVFLFLMYSSIGVIYPATEAFRPIMVVALGAVMCAVLEVTRSGRGFRLAWPEGVMVIALLGVAAISTFGSIYVSLAAETTMNFAKIVLIYIVIENIVTTTARMRTVMMTLAVGALIPALGTIYNYLTHQHLNQGRAAFYGVFANANEDAYSLVIMVPIAAVLVWRARWWLKLFLIGAIGVYVLGAFFTFSRGGLMGLVAVIGLFGWRQKSLIAKVSIVAALAVGLIVAGMFWSRKEDFSDVEDDTTVNQRLTTFRAGFDMFADHPLFGVGPGDSLVAYPLYIPKKLNCGCQDQLVVHNAFIQVLGELGAFGVIAFMGLLGTALFHAWKLQRTQNQDLRMYAFGLELALWGFAVCGLSGGFAYSWFPYLLIGLIAAARQNITKEQAKNVA